MSSTRLLALALLGASCLALPAVAFDPPMPFGSRCGSGKPGTLTRSPADFGGCYLQEVDHLGRPARLLRVKESWNGDLEVRPWDRSW